MLRAVLAVRDVRGSTFWLELPVELPEERSRSRSRKFAHNTRASAAAIF